MPIFLAVVAVLLIVAAILAHDLKRRAGADTLGLKAARAEVVADMHRRVYLSRREARVRYRATKATRFAEVYGVRALAYLYANSTTRDGDAA
ncbi:hypothetical protein OG474_09880 [Kribbella sp. NBC_01505]|uniref:hypothetical protein n=1 Tax=Kribbella sp. NBC_01505 TaxID=2903580 RepID=UPI0038660E6F